MLKDGSWHSREDSRCMHTDMPAYPYICKYTYICIHPTHTENKRIKRIKFVLLLKQHVFTQCRVTKGFLSQLFFFKEKLCRKHNITGFNVMLNFYIQYILNVKCLLFWIKGKIKNKNPLWLKHDKFTYWKLVSHSVFESKAEKSDYFPWGSK